MRTYQNLYLVRHSVNLRKVCYYVSEERISDILGTVEYITNNPYISAWTLAKLAGKIISTKFVLGDITQLKTRFIYQCIESRFSWDKKFNINNYNEMRKFEIKYFVLLLLKYFIKYVVKAMSNLNAAFSGFVLLG